MKHLPDDALRKIVSYKIGDPRHLEIKHSEALKRIQNKYKISRLGPKITRQFEIDMYIYIDMYIIECCIVREAVSFSLTMTEEKEESLAYEEVK